MNLRRFNQKGIEAFSQFLDEVHASGETRSPASLLESSDYGDAVAPTIVTPDFPASTTRYEAGVALRALLAPLPNRLDADTGLWAWLAARHFKVLCKVSKGRLKPGERARWIPNTGSFRYYRHLLAGPYLLVGAHSDDPKRALAVLSGHVSEPGDIAEQMASRQEIITNTNLMDAITRLYIDPATMKPKRGASSKSGGGARRLASLIDQLDLTWDVYGVTADNFLELLPKEFSKFREA